MKKYGVLFESIHLGERKFCEALDLAVHMFLNGSTIAMLCNIWQITMKISYKRPHFIMDVKKVKRQYICPASCQIAPQVRSFISLLNYSSLHEND